MKAIKIIVAAIVVALIGFFVFKWSVIIDKPSTVKLPANQYTARIELEIDSLIKAPESAFSKKFYNEIQYRISDYFKQGFLGEEFNDNEQWQEILSKNLYSAYAPKFVTQAMFVFKGSDWELADLNLIRTEVKLLQNSVYLEQDSPIAISFQDIVNILTKYDEIAGFIYSCNIYTYSTDSINATFPVDEVSNKIQQSKTLLTNHLDNVYVNNCTRLNDGLNEVPQILFNKHVEYLRSKIETNSGRYKEYSFQSDYSNTIYTPLKNQIDVLDNGIYGVSENIFSAEYDDLKNLLNTDNRNATDYFRSLNN